MDQHLAALVRLIAIAAVTELVREEQDREATAETDEPRPPEKQLQPGE